MKVNNRYYYYYTTTAAGSSSSKKEGIPFFGFTNMSFFDKFGIPSLQQQ
jgi:hypothetical protein